MSGPGEQVQPLWLPLFNRKFIIGQYKSSCTIHARLLEMYYILTIVLVIVKLYVCKSF